MSLCLKQEKLFQWGKKNNPFYFKHKLNLSINVHAENKT